MKLITAYGYGLVIIPINTFEQFRKEKKIRAKKMLSYFAKNNSIGDAFLHNGCLLPIGCINHWQYAVFIEIQNHCIPQGWRAVKEWKSFNLCADEDNSLWAISLEDLETWNMTDYQGKEYCQQEGVFDKYDNPLERYHAIRFNVPKGKYEAAVIGLKKENAENQYGFSIILTPVDSFTENANATDTKFNELFEE